MHTCIRGVVAADARDIGSERAQGLHALEALVLVEQSVADKENQCVYMEQVPAPETLPAITPHSLVSFSPPCQSLNST